MVLRSVLLRKSRKRLVPITLHQNKFHVSQRFKQTKINHKNSRIFFFEWERPFKHDIWEDIRKRLIILASFQHTHKVLNFMAKKSGFRILSMVCDFPWFSTVWTLSMLLDYLCWCLSWVVESRLCVLWYCRMTWGAQGKLWLGVEGRGQPPAQSPPLPLTLL